jgi:hypothetical protein
MATFLRRCQFSMDLKLNHGFTSFDSTLKTVQPLERECLPDVIPMIHIILNVPEHVGKTKEILVRILLARDTHVIDLFPCSSKETVRRTRLLVVLHGSVDIVKSLLASCTVCVRPVLDRQASQSAEHAIVSRCGTSILTAEIAEEL